MFHGLLTRLLKGNNQRPPPVPVSATAPAPGPRPMVERAPPAAPPGVGARRPLVSAQGALAGFEFHAGALDPRRMRRADDVAIAAAYTGNLLGAMRLCTSQGLAALAELPFAWLARCERDDLFSSGMHVVLQADPVSDAPATASALVARLRSQGVRVGWDPLGAATVTLADAGRPDFAPLRAPASGDTAAWRTAAAALAGRCPGVPQVLLDLPAVDVMEALLGPTVLLAACTVASCAVPPRVQALPPQAQRLLRLLDRLLHDDHDNAGVVDDIKSDAALCLRLLHYLNSAGATPGRELDSIEQAVLVLGRDKLYRWIAQMLVRMSPPRPAADALQALALARARLLEQLARSEGAQSPGSLYLLGLASMLPLLLQCSIEDAGDALHLPPAAMQALQQHAGPWLPYMALLEALEANDLAVAGKLATAFGGIDTVLACWTEAWRPH